VKIQSLVHACSALDPGRFPETPWTEIAVSGRSNVGKSSLLNCLLGRKNFARISGEPGKTRTVNFYLVNDAFYMVDLPGYGYARVSSEMRGRWKRTIFGYIEGRRALGGVVQLVDSRHHPSAGDLAILQKLVDSGRPFIVALTKADKIGRSERGRVLKEFKACFEGMTVGLYRPGKSGKTDAASGGPDRDRHRSGNGRQQLERTQPHVPFLFFSAKTKEGRGELWHWLEERIAGGKR